MSQVDRVHFFLVIWWVVVLFVMSYGSMVVKMLPKYYKVVSSRVLFEVYLFKTMLSYYNDFCLSSLMFFAK